jgi:predicted Fe-Mo cluster-binding NifX family protein
MRIVVSAQGENLDAPASPVFGRCPTYVFVDTETLEFEAFSNPAMNQAGGAGIQAAQFVVSQGAQAVLSGNLGPNAFGVLQAAGVPGYLLGEGTVRQAVQAFQAGQLRPMAGANVAGHAGMGMGRGMGGRVGMGMGRRVQPATPTQRGPGAASESEMAELRETLKGLRRQLAETMNRIEELEKEG